MQQGECAVAGGVDDEGVEVAELQHEPSVVGGDLLALRDRGAQSVEVGVGATECGEASGRLSMASRASSTSASVAPSCSRKKPAYRATIVALGACTVVPPRALCRTVISCSVSSTRNASRSVGRETPNCSVSVASAGSD